MLETKEQDSRIRLNKIINDRRKKLLELSKLANIEDANTKLFNLEDVFLSFQKELAKKVKINTVQHGMMELSKLCTRSILLSRMKDANGNPPEEVYYDRLYRYIIYNVSDAINSYCFATDQLDEDDTTFRTDEFIRVTKTRLGHICNALRMYNNRKLVAIAAFEYYEINTSIDMDCTYDEAAIASNGFRYDEITPDKILY